MFKRTLFTISILAIFITACSGQQQNLPPTVSPQEIQNTAAAAAFTMLAATQIAQPTATFVPPPMDTPIPSPTPLPTFTPELIIPIPESVIQASPTTASFVGDPTSGLGECNRILSVSDAGPLTPMRVQNMTGGIVTLSLYLNKNDFGQCGYMPGVPKTAGSYTIQLPLGNWSYFALIDYGKGKSGQDYGTIFVQMGGPGVIKIMRR